MQDLSPSESRTITPIQELGTEGVVQMVAANTNGGTLSCSRFAVYNANLFNALGLTGTGKFMPGSANDNDKYYPNRNNSYRTYHNVFKSLKDNRVPIEVMVQLNQPGEGSEPKYETYILAKDLIESVLKETPYELVKISEATKQIKMDAVTGCL